MPSMEFVNRRAPAGSGLRVSTLLLGCLILVGAAACGHQVIKGRPPFVGIADMTLSGDELTTDFNVSNPNGVPMTIDTLDITVTVEGIELLRHDQPHDIEIGANGTEDVIVKTPAGQSVRTLLDSLEKGEIGSLPMDLSGRVHTAGDGYLSFEQTGYLYPVPGRPGRFRSAVTQASELKREPLH